MIGAIVLAAGRSARMGRTKALLPIGAGTFLSTIVSTLRSAGVDEIVVVLGHDADAVRAAHHDAEVRFALNADYDRGQLSSLVAGLQALSPGVEAALVTLVDVPLVTERTVRAVIERYRRTHAAIVRPTAGDRHGHPVLFAASLFDELRAADPHAGAKPIVRRHASEDGDVPIDDEWAYTDIDTPAEYERVTAVLRARR